MKNLNKLLNAISSINNLIQRIGEKNFGINSYIIALELCKISKTLTDIAQDEINEGMGKAINDLDNALK